MSDFIRFYNTVPLLYCSCGAITIIIAIEDGISIPHAFVRNYYMPEQWGPQNEIQII